MVVVEDGALDVRATFVADGDEFDAFDRRRLRVDASIAFDDNGGPQVHAVFDNVYVDVTVGVSAQKCKAAETPT